MEMIHNIWEWSLTNKEWVYGGIGITAILWVLGFLNVVFKSLTKILFPKSDSTVVNFINNLNSPVYTEQQKSEPNQCKHTPEQRKALTQILFIDDETGFKVINILKKVGWVNTRLIKRINGPDDENILKADICFIDINGVAKDLFPVYEGLGLVGAIRDRHPHKKIVVYSSQQQRDAFNSLWDKADARLPKNADPYEFENLIENFSEEIYC